MVARFIERMFPQAAGACRPAVMECGLTTAPGRTQMDLKLEVIPIPVSDVDAAKAFYTEQVGFNLDHDARPTEHMRVVQMTPPGSACSVVIGEGLPLGAPGSVKGVQLVVEDIDAVREALAGRGVGVGDVQQLGPEGTPGSRFLFFEDPDGNTWAVQELKRS
jgi:catechol 2,3-dioxygenase-like lactoylglutathione lyase family enzyme